MALVEPAKKGGRYTVKEQEERRIQVYHLYFEENKSAVKIAKLLGVNRNTINDDITYWHSQLVDENNSQTIIAKMTKQIQRMELQRDRLLEFLDDADFDQKFKIEKFISDIDNRLMQHYSKMIQRRTILKSTAKIDESEIKELVRDFIIQEELKELHSKNELKFRFIHKTKCNEKHADRLIERMIEEGLDLCSQSENTPDYFKIISGDFTQTYNLEKFAYMRDYITMDESVKINKRHFKLKAELKRKEESNERLAQEYVEQEQHAEEFNESILSK